MKPYKKFVFWLTIMAIGICSFSFLGYDDKNLLLFFMTPPIWITETHWFVENFIHPSNIPLRTIYIFTILFWMVLGIVLDAVAKKFTNKKKH